MSTLFLITAANLLISLVSLSGLFTLALTFLGKKSISTILVAFAAGVLLATSFLNILPEAFEGLEHIDALMWAMFGVIGAFLMERFLLWYHHHHEDTHDIHPTSLLVIVGDGIHNFVDGLAIAAAFIVNPMLGVTTTLAVAAHEIPQEIADYSVLKHCGMSTQKALFWNFISALSAVIGGLIGFLVFQNSPAFVYVALAISAGIFFYIAASDLIPELHQSEIRSDWLKQTLSFLFGTGIILIFALTGHHH